VFKKYKFLIIGVFVLIILTLVGVLLTHLNLTVLTPKGVIAEKERNLMIIGTLLSVVVVLPVFFMLFFIAWKYRASNTKARYEPEWDSNRALESAWWGIPCVIILILGVVTWQSTHALDPYKALDSPNTPIKVQVVSLDWKWLFIYPDLHIASVNFLQFPVNTPVNFQLTSDAPMNSFWIPSLGGQIYTMTGMSTQLHLMADTKGDYHGASANISGVGFAGMQFVARASSKTDFDKWVREAQHSNNLLDASQYATLVKPSQNNPATSYRLMQSNLYDTILMKYMAPDTTNTMPDMPGMEMK
jgi:cytochrome o ubiquinol oxidase subunit 2